MLKNSKETILVLEMYKRDRNKNNSRKEHIKEYSWMQKDIIRKIVIKNGWRTSAHE